MPSAPSETSAAAKPTSLCASPRRGMRLTGPRASRRQRRRAVAHEGDEAAARDRGRALAEREDEQRVVARADARRDRDARELGQRARRRRLRADLRLGRAWPASWGPRPTLRPRSAAPGPRVQSAGLPTCQNHSPAASPAGAVNCTSDGSAGAAVPSRRPPSSAMAPQPSTTAGERATRTTSAPCPRAVNVNGAPAWTVAPSAGATGVGTGACAAAGAASTAAAASAAAERRRNGSIPGHGRGPLRVRLGGCPIKPRRGRRSARRRRCRR